MAIDGIHYLPLITFILFPTTFFGSYIAAVLQGHVAPEFPYISDVGTYVPESCVFGQFINIGAVLLCILVYIRYCEVCQYYESYSISPKVVSLNKLGVWLGVFAALGLSIVANFQETSLKYVHYVGATLCFGLGSMYFWIQAMCSYHMHPMANSMFVAHLRVFLAMVSTVSFFVASVAGLMAHLRFKGDDPRKWLPNDGGFQLHVASTISEWIVAICFSIYLLTFYSEFSEISFSHPQEEEGEVDEREEEALRQKILSLSMSLLMAALVQALSSLGHLFEQVFYLFRWTSDQPST